MKITLELNPDEVSWLRNLHRKRIGRAERTLELTGRTMTPATRDNHESRKQLAETRLADLDRQIAAQQGETDEDHLSQTD